MDDVPVAAAEQSRDGGGDFRDLFDAAALGMAEADPGTGIFLRINPAGCRIFGYSEAELVGRFSFLDITFDADRARNEEQYRRLLAGEIRSYTMEKRYVRKDGTIRWGRISVALTRDADGGPKSSLAVIEDITAQKWTEDRLLLALEVGDLGMWEWDLETDVAICSPSYALLYRLRQQPTAGDTLTVKLAEWVSRLHPDDRQHALATIERAKAGGHYADEFRIVWPDGTIRWIASRGRFETDAAGRPVRMIGVNIDITPRIATEALKVPASSFDEREFAAGTIIFWQGDPARELYQIMSGTVKIYKVLPDGRNQILGFEHPGDILGFPDEQHYGYCAEALGRVAVRKFSASEIDGRRGPFRSILHRVALGAVHGLRESHEHVGLLGVTSARERLMRFLMTLPTPAAEPGRSDGWTPLPMSRQDIADYLALRRETVSRVLAALRDEGLVELGPRKVRLLHREKMRREIESGRA